MDVVYICRSGDNEELRYSIRSVVANMPHDSVWVVGDKPDWYSGNFIKIDHKKNTKYARARENLTAITESKDISDSFILMNDDFYIINKIDSLPVLHGKTLQDKIDLYQSVGASDSYVKMLEQTNSIITNKLNISNPIDYELHVPMEMTKRGLRKALMTNGLWRSVYGNLTHTGIGSEMNDVKVLDENTPGYQRSYDITNLVYDYLSSNDDTFDLLYETILKDRFPDPSPYEI